MPVITSKDSCEISDKRLTRSSLTITAFVFSRCLLLKFALFWTLLGHVVEVKGLVNQEQLGEDSQQELDVKKHLEKERSSNGGIDDKAETMEQASAIGFDFILFDKEVDHFLISSNGLIGLRKGGEEKDAFGLSSSFSNQALGQLSGEDFSYTLFPFWDDLYSYSSKQHVLSALVEKGHQSNPFDSDIQVIQYFDYGFYNETLAFGTAQVILVKKDYEIYFNYIDLPNSRSKGGSATIGITGLLSPETEKQWLQVFSHDSDDSNSGCSCQCDLNAGYDEGDDKQLKSRHHIRFTPDGQGSYEVSALTPELAYPEILYDGSPPPASFNLVSPGEDEGSVTAFNEFLWSKSENATSYRFIIARDLNLCEVVFDEGNLGEEVSSFTLTDPALLTVGQSYVWAVQAINEEGAVWSETRNSFTVVEPLSLSGTPEISVLEGGSYLFTPKVEGAEPNMLSFSITDKPPWLDFDDKSGELQGIPGEQDIGVTTGIVISVSDGQFSVNLPPFNLEVVNVNYAPAIWGTAAGEVEDTASYVFVPKSRDPDAGDSLTFSIINKPDWASFNPGTGALTGTPGIGAGGIYDNIIIRVTDSGGLRDSLEPFSIRVVADSDSDGIWDHLDLDDDNDGVPDSQELIDGSDPLDNSSYLDSDNDGVADFSDEDDDNDGVPDTQELIDGSNPLDNSSFLDNDHDGLADFIDEDDDNDGVPDSLELADGSDPLDNSSYLDSDNDGVADFIDEDDDNDNVPDNQELIDGSDPLDNSSFLDSDNDGLADFIDEDDDNDNVPDSQELIDGSDPLNNASYLDYDYDSIPDFIDEDDDNDQVPDSQELIEGTDPRDRHDFQDTERDGIPDFIDDDDDNDNVPDLQELTEGTNPNNPDDYQDSDGDSVPDFIEVNVDNTDPYAQDDAKDSDNDGISDYLADKWQFIAVNDTLYLEGTQESGRYELAILANDNTGDGLTLLAAFSLLADVQIEGEKIIVTLDNLEQTHITISYVVQNAQGHFAHAQANLILKN